MKRCNRRFLVAFALANLTAILLLPLRFKGFAIGVSIELWLLIALCFLLDQKLTRSHAVMTIFLAAILHSVVKNWTMATLDGYADRLGTKILHGEEWKASLESPPFIAHVFCFGRMGWFREEAESMGLSWERIEAAARQCDDVACDRALKTLCQRCDEGRSLDISHYVAQRIAKRLRDAGFARAKVCSEDAMFRRGKAISAFRAGKNAIDITTFTNAAEYVVALFAQNGGGNPEDIERAKREWSFAVGVPDEAPETFPVMIPSALDPSALPTQWAGGTNSAAYVYFAETEEGLHWVSGRFTFVGRMGEIRQVRCYARSHGGTRGRYGYCAELWKILGEKPYSFASDVYYLTPTGKVQLSHAMTRVE